MFYREIDAEMPFRRKVIPFRQKIAREWNNLVIYKQRKSQRFTRKGCGSDAAIRSSSGIIN